MLPNLQTIAGAIRATRPEFNRLYLQVQVDFVLDPGQRVSFDAIGLSGVDAEAFEQALRHASAQGWLEPLVYLIVQEGLEDGTLARALAEEGSAEGNAALQAMANAAAGFMQPELLYRGVANSTRWTVKVLIDGAARGTGILIGPHLVLTAWHVVRELFRPSAAGWEPHPDAAPRLQVEFDDYLTIVGKGALAPGNTQRVGAHPQWSVVFSPCHAEELNQRLPADLAQLEGWWDYAVIRLAKTPGIERRWASLDARAVVPKPQARILVFQHPAALPMRLDQNDIAMPDPGAAASVPRLRFLHLANALGGSSGGPCFDKTFMLIGLHQGEWVARMSDGRRINRGVPLVRVLEHIKNQIRDLPAPDPSETPTWRLGPAQFHAPVIGCDDFQSLIWRSAIAGAPRIILVEGGPKTGKSFQLQVLSAILPDGGHLKVGLEGPAISRMDASGIAARICEVAAAAVPSFAAIPELDASASTWIKDEVIYKLIAALDKVRAGRLVWITIADLNKTDIQGKLASPLLLALYEQTRTVEWLRIVLDGMKGDIPASIRPLSRRHDVSEPTIDEIKAYVRRAVAALGLQPPIEHTVSFAAKTARKDYQNWRAADPENAMRLLSERAQEMVEVYLDGGPG